MKLTKSISMAAIRSQFLHMVFLIVILSPSSYALTWVFIPYTPTYQGKCSTTCKSKFCKEAPLLRYGKYCGIFYTGCAGEAPCDGLDRCCMIHDHCIGSSDYLSEKCNRALLECIEAYKNSGDGQFIGNSCKIGAVEKTIRFAIKAGVWIGEGIGNASDSLSPSPNP